MPVDAFGNPLPYGPQFRGRRIGDQPNPALPRTREMFNPFGVGAPDRFGQPGIAAPAPVADPTDPNNFQIGGGLSGGYGNATADPRAPQASAFSNMMGRIGPAAPPQDMMFRGGPGFAPPARPTDMMFRGGPGFVPPGMQQRPPMQPGMAQGQMPSWMAALLAQKRAAQRGAGPVAQPRPQVPVRQTIMPTQNPGVNLRPTAPQVRPPAPVPQMRSPAPAPAMRRAAPPSALRPAIPRPPSRY